MKQTGDVPVAEANHPRQLGQAPGLRWVSGDRVLDTMYGRVDVIATLQPWRKLRITATATQIHDEIARNGDCVELSNELTDQVQHEIDTRRDSRAQKAEANNHKQTEEQNRGFRSQLRQFGTAGIM